MRLLLIAMIVAVQLLGGAVYAQDGAPITLHYVPRGEFITVDGVEMIAYDVETFVEIAEIDARLFAAERDIAALEELVDLQTELLDERTLRIEELESSQADWRGMYLECEEDLALSLEIVDDYDDLLLDTQRRSWIQPGHFLVEAGLTLFLGYTIYLLSRD